MCPQSLMSKCAQSTLNRLETSLGIRRLARAVDRAWNCVARPQSAAILVAIASLSAALVISSCSASLNGLQSTATATNALNVNSDSHVVVMEYEAWFGPNA